MIAHFTINCDNSIGNLLSELWENDCLKEQQKSVVTFDMKRDWYLNNTTTEFCNNSEERKPKTTTEEHKMVKREIDTKIVKIEAEADVLLKGTNNEGNAKQDAKNDKDKEYPTPAESRNQHNDKKNKHKFGKFNCPSKQQQKNKF